MTPKFIYKFSPTVPQAEVGATLLLATWAAEAVHGSVAVRLTAGYSHDPQQGVCVIAVSGRAGRDLNRVFAGLAAKEFGEDAFRVDRVLDVHNAPHPQSSPDGQCLILADAQAGGDE